MSNKNPLLLRDVFAKHMQQRRQQLNFSQGELADRAGLHRTYIGSVERGERSISIDAMEKLAEALNTTVAAMISEKNDSVNSTEEKDLVDPILREELIPFSVHCSRDLEASMLLKRGILHHDLLKSANEFQFYVQQYYQVRECVVEEGLDGSFDKIIRLVAANLKHYQRSGHSSKAKHKSDL